MDIFIGIIYEAQTREIIFARIYTKRELYLSRIYFISQKVSNFTVVARKIGGVVVTMSKRKRSVKNTSIETGNKHVYSCHASRSRPNCPFSFGK